MATDLQEESKVAAIVARPNQAQCNGWSLVVEPATAGPAVPAPSLDDTVIVSRVIRAYNHAVNKATSDGKSMWQNIFDLHHREIDEVFRHGDVATATAILRDPVSTNLFFGFDAHVLSLRSQLEQPPTQAYWASIYMDNLLRLAEVIGAIAPFNREQHDGHGHKPMCWEADAVIERIEEVLGVRLSFPNPFPNEVGLSTSRGVMSDRVPHALYQAWRIKQLANGVANPRVLELGAGLGRTAYFARQLGIQDYTIIDIPFTGISQGYFLGRTLGPENVLLSGESTGEKPGQANTARVKILDPAAFLDNARSYDIILNADSLTEMSPGVARAYMDQIASRTKVFLSINHEYNPFTVRQLISETRGVHSVHRHLYSLRQGYVEELVHF